jgi:hypothetical protein
MFLEYLVDGNALILGNMNRFEPNWPNIHQALDMRNRQYELASDRRLKVKTAQ